MRVGYKAIDAWAEILDSKDPFESNTQVQSLIKFLCDNKVYGMIMNVFDLYVSIIFNYPIINILKFEYN